MTLVDVVAAALFVGVLAYAIFGGADFGSGSWDLTAGGPTRGASLRSLVDRSIGPVWEANHVWLIFVLVVLWTGFPPAFGAIVTTLEVPLALAAVGITMRGAGFAFRKFAPSVRAARVFGATFALSSVVTPFFLGAVVGSVASGRVPADGGGDAWTSWTGPASLVGGLLAVLTCSYLAGTFLLADAERGGQAELVSSLRRRVLGVGALTGLVVLGGALPLRADAPVIFERLSGRGVVFVVASAVAGGASLLLVVRGEYARARAAAVAGVAAVLAGWGFAQYPWILVDELTLEEAAGARPTLVGLVGVTVVAALIVVPSLVWLFRLVHEEAWTGTAHHTEGDPHLGSP